MLSPPKPITAEYLTSPSKKIHISVVPPPISTNTTPKSFSCFSKTDAAEPRD